MSSADLERRAACRSGSGLPRLTFLLAELGRPFSSAGFANWCRNRGNEARPAATFCARMMGGTRARLLRRDRPTVAWRQRANDAQAERDAARQCGMQL